MKNKKLDAARVWKQVDDDVVPQLRLCVIDRAVYFLSAAAQPLGEQAADKIYNGLARKRHQALHWDHTHLVAPVV